MLKRSKRSNHFALFMALGWLALITTPPLLLAGDGSLPQPFQFSDSYYRANGIDPSKITDKLNCGDSRTKCDEPAPSSNFSSVRITETTGGFDHSGNLLYYMVPGKLQSAAFLDNAAGKKAKELANQFHAFLFPRKDGNPLSPAFPNRRQDNIFDTRNGYFSNNPLGLWRLTFVSWDGPNVESATCQLEMNSLAAANGRDLDSTPVIRTVSEIENLAAGGCVALRERAEDGRDGFPWVI